MQTAKLQIQTVNLKIQVSYYTKSQIFQKCSTFQTSKL